MAIDERVKQLEADVKALNLTMTSIASDFKFIREKIENYLQTHDLVIRQEERIKTANNRIKDLEDTQKKHGEKISNMAVKVAMISGGLSIIITIVLNLLGK